MQAPYHGDRKADNQNICQEIEYATDDGKKGQIDASGVLNGSVPEGRDGSALKDDYRSETKPLAKDDCGAYVNG